MCTDLNEMLKCMRQIDWRMVQLDQKYFQNILTQSGLQDAALVTWKFKPDNINLYWKP